MRARRTAIMAAALALSVSALGACSGQDEEQGPSGDPDPDEPSKQAVVYVKLAFSDGNWVAVDAQKEKP